MSTSNLTINDDIDNIISDINPIGNSSYMHNVKGTASNNIWSAGTTYSQLTACFPAQQASTSNYEAAKKSNSKILELEQIDGSMLLLEINPSYIEGMSEKIEKTRRIVSKFPFVVYDKLKYLELKYRGTTYKLNTTITALADILGIEYTSYAELQLKDTIKNG